MVGVEAEAEAGEAVGVALANSWIVEVAVLAGAVEFEAPLHALSARILTKNTIIN